MRNIIVFLFLLFCSQNSFSQCTYKNTAFKSGEFLTYNLYYNWKFIWVKAGTASMSTVQSTHNGIPAWRSSLITRGNKKVDELFVLRDTILGYTSLDLAPLYYRKGAREGKRYTFDEIFYDYAGNKCNVRQHRQHNDGTHSWEKHSYSSITTGHTHGRNIAIKIASLI